MSVGLLELIIVFFYLTLVELEGLVEYLLLCPQLIFSSLGLQQLLFILLHLTPPFLYLLSFLWLERLILLSQLLQTILELTSNEFLILIFLLSINVKLFRFTEAILHLIYLCSQCSLLILIHLIFQAKLTIFSFTFA